MEDDPVLDWSVEDDEQREQYPQTSAQAPAAAFDEETISLGGDEEDDDEAYYAPQTTDRDAQQTLRAAGSPPARDAEPALNESARSSTPVGRAEDPPQSPRASGDSPRSSPPPDDASKGLQPRVPHALPPKPHVAPPIPFSSRVTPHHSQDASARSSNRRERKMAGNGFVVRTREVTEVAYTEAPLPPNWLAKYSRTSKQKYYYNEITEESRWEHPSVANIKDLCDGVLCHLMAWLRRLMRRAKATAMEDPEDGRALSETHLGSSSPPVTVLGSPPTLLRPEIGVPSLSPGMDLPHKPGTHRRREIPLLTPDLVNKALPCTTRRKVARTDMKQRNVCHEAACHHVACLKAAGCALCLKITPAVGHTPAPPSGSPSLYRSALPWTLSYRSMDTTTPIEVDVPGPQSTRKRDRPSRFDRPAPLPPAANASAQRSQSVEEVPPPPKKDAAPSMYPNRKSRARSASPPADSATQSESDSRPPPPKRAPLPPQHAQFTNRSSRPRSPPPAPVVPAAEPEVTKAPSPDERRPMRPPPAPRQDREPTDRDTEQTMDADEPPPPRTGGMYADREGASDREDAQDRVFRPRNRDAPRGGPTGPRGRTRGRGGPPQRANDVPRGPRAMANGVPDQAPSSTPLRSPDGPVDPPAHEDGPMGYAPTGRGGYERRSSPSPMRVDDPPPLAPFHGRGDRGRPQELGRRPRGGRGRAPITGTNSTPVAAPRPFGAAAAMEREPPPHQEALRAGKEVYERSPEFVPRQPEPPANNAPYSEPRVVSPVDRRGRDNGWTLRGQTPTRMGTRSVTPPPVSRNPASNFNASPPFDRRADNGRGRYPMERGVSYPDRRGPYPPSSDRPFDAPDDRPMMDDGPFANDRRFDSGPEDNGPRFPGREFVEGNGAPHGRARGGRGGRGRKNWQDNAPVMQHREFEERREDFARGPPPHDMYPPRAPSPRGPPVPFYDGPVDGRPPPTGPAYDDRGPDFFPDAPPMRNGPSMRGGMRGGGPMRHGPPPHMRLNGPPVPNDVLPMHAGPSPRDSPPLMRNGYERPTLLSRISNVEDVHPVNEQFVPRQDPPFNDGPPAAFKDPAFVPFKRAREDNGLDAVERSPKAMRVMDEGARGGAGGPGGPGGAGFTPSFEEGGGGKRRRGRSGRGRNRRGPGGGGGGGAFTGMGCRVM
ncbi:hypothetical protein K523DRAFT_370764 [Schizophyllum commune Tattone D]|nr:hypothetical protein K523DRAFT_370764 [Schizophyllum commune Tattone D]